MLIAVGALLANAQCYGTCLGNACNAAQTPSDSCHHHKSSHDDARCPYQHHELASPDTSIAKITLALATLDVAVPVSGSIAVCTDSHPRMQPATGAPPAGDIATTISVLRI